MSLIHPHGGTLVNRTAQGAKREALRKATYPPNSWTSAYSDAPFAVITPDTYQDFVLGA